MKLRIDRDLCTGTGTCVRQAPQFLVLTRDGGEIYAELLPGGTATEQEMRAAAESCPWAAVTLEDDDGTLLFP